MRPQHPKSIGLSAEGMETDAPRQVPDANGAILRVGDEEVALSVEHEARHVVRVASQRVNLPGLVRVESARKKALRLRWAAAPGRAGGKGESARRTSRV